MPTLPEYPRQARVYVDPYEVDARLDQLGLRRAAMELAVEQGELQRRLCTPLDFSATPGYVAWGRTLRAVREETIPLGWHPGDLLQIPVTYNPDESIAVAVSSGDENTGVLTDRDPATKTVKGQATIHAVEANKIPFGRNPYDDEEDMIGVELWYLLYCSDEHGLRAELSSPRTMDTAGRIAGWSERILLGTIGGDDAQAAPLTDISPVLDVPVLRKSS
jgi:hypothetical protein